MKSSEAITERIIASLNVQRVECRGDSPQCCGLHLSGWGHLLLHCIISSLAKVPHKDL